MSVSTWWWGNNSWAGRVRAFVVLTLLASVLSFVPVAAQPVYANHVGAHFTVDSATDAPDANPGNGVCATTGQQPVCTLRAAVQEANATAAGGAVITIPAGTYPLTAGELTISRAMTLEGAAAPVGAGATIIDAGGASRVFNITAGSPVVLRGLVIRNGSTNQQGGGLRVAIGAAVSIEDSTVSGSSAREGGGLYNNGAVTARRSTFSGNSSSQKGGGAFSDGTLNVVNSTFSANWSKNGGAITVAGTANVSFSTIFGNTTDNKNSGGIDRNGGTVRIKYSILGNNLDSSNVPHDCSGTPDLLGINLVRVLQGCNPVGQVLVGDPLLGPLANNGGATLTHAVLGGSPVANVVPQAQCTDLANVLVTVDQRKVARPNDAACELGSYEIAPLTIGVSLAADAAQVGVGAREVPVANILAAVQASADPGTPVASTPLSSIPWSSIPLSSIDPVANPLSSIPLSSIPLSSIATAVAPLSSIPLSSIPLSSILLSELSFDVDIDALLEGTIYADVPKQALTLQDVLSVPGVAALTLDDVTFGSTPLSSIPLSSILFVSTPLSSIPLSSILAGGTDVERLQAWCDFFAGTLCTDFGIDPAIPSTADGITLMTLAFAQVDLTDVPLSSIPLSSIGEIADFPLSSILLADLAWGATPLSSIPLSSIETALGSTPLSSIANCSLVDCTTATLGEAAAAGALVGDVASLLVAADALASYSLADLLFAVFGVTEVPWEDIDIRSVPLQAAAEPKQPAFRYLVGLTVDGPPADTVTATLSLPAGFAYAADLADASQLDGVTIGAPVVTGNILTGSTLTYSLASVAPGAHTLRVAVRAGIDLGVFTASVTASATSGTQNASAGPATAGIEVVDVGEPNDPILNATLLQDALVNLQHVSTTQDVDLFTFEIPPAAVAASARILLSDLPADYDLTLFGPPLAAPLRGTPTTEFTLLEDIVFDLTPDDETLTTDTLQDIPLNTVDSAACVVGQPGSCVLHSISATRSTNDERIDTGTLRPGIYYVQVSSYNGLFSGEPYVLRAKFSSGSLPACLPRLVNPIPTPGALPAGFPDGLNTLFVTHLGLLQTAFPDDGNPATPDSSDIVAELGLVGTTAWTDLGVVGSVLYVDGDTDVAGAYEALRTDRCNPDRSNDVVREIGRVIDEVIAQTGADIENVVIVGDDSIVPMARIPDGVFVSNERTHLQNLAGNNELIGALRGGYYLSDHPYGSDVGIAINDHEAFFPTRAVGRLVETADQIATQLGNFVAYQGRLDPASAAVPDALVTGYDFLTDGANSVKDALEADGFTVSTLISEQWTRQNLIDALDDPALEVASVNAHFDETRALPAIGNLTGDETDLFTTQDLAGIAGLSRALLFSMGCHSGLSTSDIQLGGPIVMDFAETLVSKDVVFAGNTGYGYGDTELVALSERLTTEFAANIRDNTVGEAWVFSIQDYASQLLVVTPYDEKIVQEFVLYGLPMYRVGDPSPVPVSFPAGIDQAESGSPFQAAALAGASTNAAPPTGTDPRTGFTIAPLSFGLVVGPSSGPGVLNLVTTPDGDYYEVDGGVLTAQDRPVQPLLDIDVTQPVGSGLHAVGGLVTRLVSQGEVGFTPLIFNPVVDLDAHEPRTITGDPTFPAVITGVTTSVDAAGDPLQKLLVVPGRFLAGASPGIGTQQLFTEIDVAVYYGDPAVDKPLIRRSIGRVGDGIVHFEVVVADADRVTAAFIPEGVTASTAWTFVELLNVAGTNTWIGGRPAGFGGEVDFQFFVQAVNEGGVSLSDGKGENFETIRPVDSDNVTITLTGPEGDNGWFTGNVTATVTTQPGVTADSYSLDAGPFTPWPGAQGIVITGEGGHILRVLDSTGEVALAFAAIDSIDPTAQAALDPEPVGGWSGGAVTVTITAADGVGSGVASVSYSIDGGTTEVVPGDTAIVPVSTEGDTTVSFFATDFAGNQSAVGEITVSIDLTAPTVTATVSPAANDAGWHNATPVTVGIAATDGASGVASITYQATGAGSIGETTVAGAATNVEVTAEGTTTVSFSATDVAGNPSVGGSVDVKIDLTDPSVTPTQSSTAATAGGWTNGTVTVTLDATDAGSGVESISYSTGGDYTTVSGDSTSFDVSAEGATTVTFYATDVAGNPSVVDSIEVKIDTTAPVVTCGSSDGLWHAADVSIGCTATDAGAGLANAADAAFSLTTSVPAGTADANALTDSRSVCDLFAQCTQAGPIGGNKVDKQAPTATITTPIDGAVYTINQAVTADYGCADGAGSGIASCAGPVAVGSPLDTSSAGIKTFQVTATDNVGNTSTVTVSYTVAYNICLLYDPTQAKNIGSVYPIKVQLCDANGTNLSARQITLLAVKIDGTIDPPPNDAGGANQGNKFRYLATTQSYIYNLDTNGLGAGPHTLDFTVDGGTRIYRAPFTLG